MLFLKEKQTKNKTNSSISFEVKNPTNHKALYHWRNEVCIS